MTPISPYLLVRSGTVFCNIGVNYSSNGSRYIITTGGGAVVAETSSGRDIPHLASGQAVIEAVLGRSGGLAFTSHSDNAVRVWNVATGGLLSTLTGHTSTPIGLCALDGGRLLLTWGDDATIILWSTLDGALLRRFTTHDDDVLDVAPVDKNSAIISVDNGGVVWRHNCDGADTRRI